MPKVEPLPSEDCWCPHCRKIFSTVDAFDLHRQPGTCVDPAEVEGLARHVGPERWGLTEDVAPEWYGPFEQLELPLTIKKRNTAQCQS